MPSVTNPNAVYASSNVAYARPVITGSGMHIVDAIKHIEDNLDHLNAAVLKFTEVDSDWKISSYSHALNTNYFGKTRLILRNAGIEINLDIDEDTLEKLSEDLQTHLTYIRDTRSKWYLGELSK